jgi:two-component system response regulator YesN
MISVLVADDEKLIRAGIKKILAESIGIPLNIIEAKNGKEALEFIISRRPEILITDIRMPIMDGVELMREVSALEAKPSIIVLSGYDDFAYAQQAIKNGAIAYILKPLERKDFMETVSAAIVARREAERGKRELALRRIMDGAKLDGIEAEAVEALLPRFRCAALSGERCLERFERAVPNADYYLIESRGAFACLAAPAEAFTGLDSAKGIDGATLGLSLESSSLADLRSLREQAMVALMGKYFCPAPRVFAYAAEWATRDFAEADAAYERFLGRLDLSAPETISAETGRLLDFSAAKEEDRPALLHHAYLKVTADLTKRFPAQAGDDMYLGLKAIMIENIWQCESLREWVSAVSDYAIYLSALLKRGSIEYPFVKEALDYMEAHAGDNINMAVVANQVSVNYTYFSEKFKEHTGINFNEYLKRLRIERAKSLLESGIYKVYEVAARSGFGDVKYFMKTFKAATGLSPSEYKMKTETR